MADASQEHEDAEDDAEDGLGTGCWCLHESGFLGNSQKLYLWPHVRAAPLLRSVLSEHSERLDLLGSLKTIAVRLRRK